MLLTLTNPATILSFIAVFAGLGLGGSATRGNFLAATLLVGGVFFGSAFWWLLLSVGVGLFREKLGPARLGWLNWISGGILCAFGVEVLWEIFR